jgi:hypothetical protein
VRIDLVVFEADELRVLSSGAARSDADAYGSNLVDLVLAEPVESGKPGARARWTLRAVRAEPEQVEARRGRQVDSQTPSPSQRRRGRAGLPRMARGEAAGWMVSLPSRRSLSHDAPPLPGVRRRRNSPR